MLDAFNIRDIRPSLRTIGDSQITDDLDESGAGVLSTIPNISDTSLYDVSLNYSKLDILIEETLIDPKFHFNKFQNSVIFSQSEKMKASLWRDFSKLLNFPMTVPQNDSISKSKQQLLEQTRRPIRNLNTVLSNIPNKFDISDITQIKNFIYTSAVLDIPSLPARLDKIISYVSSFMHKIKRNGKSKIGVFIDEDIENFQSVTIEYFVDATAKECRKWTDLLVLEIILMDERMLNIIQVEIIPDDV